MAHNLPLYVKVSLWAPDSMHNVCGHCELRFKASVDWGGKTFFFFLKNKIDMKDTINKAPQNGVFMIYKVLWCEDSMMSKRWPNTMKKIGKVFTIQQTYIQS